MAKAFEGQNYEGWVEDGLLIVRVWRRRDLDSTAGARCAEDLRQDVSAFAGDTVQGLVWDMREAPTSFGPMTQSVVGKLIRGWCSTGKPLAFITASPMQRLLLQRLATESGRGEARIFGTMDEAKAFAHDPSGAPEGAE